LSPGFPSGRKVNANEKGLSKDEGENRRIVQKFLGISWGENGQNFEKKVSIVIKGAETALAFH